MNERIENNPIFAGNRITIRKRIIEILFMTKVKNSIFSVNKFCNSKFKNLCVFDITSIIVARREIILINI